MIITLYNQTKAHNSTERITTDGQDINGVLKDESSIVNPVVKMRQSSISNNITQYSYAYIPEFGRYYFITDKRFVDGLWELHMHCDVLATWRSQIGSSSQYIMRSGVPGDVDDSMRAPGLEPFVNTSMIFNQLFDDQAASSTPGINDIGNGVYIVTMAGAPDNPAGSFVNNSYLLTKAEFNQLREELSTSAFTGINPSLDDITDNVAKVLINPFQYVVNCYYLPISKPRLNINGTSSHIRYGWYRLNTYGLALENPIVIKTVYDGILFKHPEYNSSHRRMYNSSRWINYWIQYPMIGRINIPNDPIIDAARLTIYYTLDVVSGDVVLWGFGSDANGSTAGFERFVISQQNWGIKIELSSYLRDATSAINSGLGVVNTAQNVVKDVLSWDFAGAINDATKGTISAATAGARARAAQVQNIGSQGTFAAIGYPGSGIVVEYYLDTHIASPFMSRIGNLTLKQATISSVATLPNSNTPALIVCGNPVLGVPKLTNINWTSDEYNEIIGYMRSGFYYV